jgi:hypothetical protein
LHGPSFINDNGFVVQLFESSSLHDKYSMHNEELLSHIHSSFSIFPIPVEHTSFSRLEHKIVLFFVVEHLLFSLFVTFQKHGLKILFIIYYLLFIIYYLLFIIYYLLFIIYYLLFIIYYLLFIIYYSLFIIHYLLFIIYYSLLIIHY